MQAKKQQNARAREVAARNMGLLDYEDASKDKTVSHVENLLSMIPAEVIASRSVECRSYARALFHWEQYIRQVKIASKTHADAQVEPLYERLQDIYTQIDEPDGIEGISAHLQVLNVDQQILQHRKAGRWTAAQSWYEMQLADNPKDTDIQVNLLTCLKESGNHGMTKLPLRE
jgi:serine/threonine-protein kinase ATR